MARMVTDTTPHLWGTLEGRRTMGWTSGDEIQYTAQLADMKEIDYRHSLVIAALCELLVAKGIIGRQEIREKARELDALAAGAFPSLQ